MARAPRLRADSTSNTGAVRSDDSHLVEKMVLHSILGEQKFTAFAAS